MADMDMLEMIAVILVIIGGLNWGLYGALNMDLVNMLLGSIPILAQAVYVLVGLSAVYMAYVKFAK
jgi:hypothetical protein